MTILSAVCLIPVLVMTLLLGHYGDLAGRKVVLLPAVAGLCLRGFISMAVVHYKLSLLFLLAAGVLDAFTGSAVTVGTSVYSYIVDITSPRSRTLRLVIVELALGIGITIGGAMTGLVIGNYGFLYAFMLPTVALAINVLYVAFYIKETVPSHEKVTFFTVSHIHESLRLFARYDGTSTRTMLIISALFLSVYSMEQNGTHDITTFYLLGTPLCFTPQQVGYFTSAGTAIEFPVSMLGAVFLVPRIGPTAVMMISSLSGVASQILFGFATTKVLVYCGE